MPPKKDSDQAGNDAVRSLCYLLMTSRTFEPNLAELAQYVGVKDKKNVPRKINSLVSPYGFEFKDQKITQKDFDLTSGSQPVTPSSTSAISKKGEPYTPKTPTIEKKRVKTTPKLKPETQKKTPNSKKRKADDVDETEQLDVENKDEVQEMIMAAMGGDNEGDQPDINENEEA